MSPVPSLLRTALMTAASFVVVSAVWLQLGSVYDAVLASVANAFLGSGLRVDDFSGILVFSDQAQGGKVQGLVDTLSMHVGPAVMLALAAATPARPWLWRAMAGICVVGTFLLVQAIAIAGMAYAFEASLDGRLLGSDVLIAFSIFWGLMPLVIGGVWVYRLWLPVLRSSPSTRGKRRRNASSAADRSRT